MKRTIILLLASVLVLGVGAGTAKSGVIAKDLPTVKTEMVAEMPALNAVYEAPMVTSFSFGTIQNFAILNSSVEVAVAEDALVRWRHYSLNVGNTRLTPERFNARRSYRLRC